MRIHGKVDTNQAELRRAARKIGASWLGLSDVGRGCPDAILGYRGKTWLVEVKRTKGTLTPDQVKFIASWRGSKIYIVRSVDDVLQLLQS